MIVEFACSLTSRLHGLLGRDEFDGVLVLAPCGDVHTFGMRHKLDIAFASVDGIVLASHRAIPPRRRLSCRGATITLERFAAETPWYEPGDRIEIGEPRRSS